MPINPAKLRKITRRAWRLVREGVRRYGGGPRQYLAEALRLAWAEAKGKVVVLRPVRAIPSRAAMVADGTTGRAASWRGDGMEKLQAVVDEARAHGAAALDNHGYLSTSEWLCVCLAAGTAESIDRLKGGHYPSVPEAWRRIGPTGQRFVLENWNTH